MKIVNLIENTEGRAGCIAAHGLSFYIETPKHKLLMDLGPSQDTISNAEAMGIDLSEVDTVVLSHGHYDHSGGIMPFTEKNDKATIYMQASATGDFYSISGEEYKYIGIDKAIASLPQVMFATGDLKIDDELSLFTIEKKVQKIPFTNWRLKKKCGEEYLQDDFCHEQALVVEAEGKTILLSGCAHNGMINILEEYKRKYKAEPDIAISGFHLVKKTEYSSEQLQEIRDTAESLKKYHTKFYTCHCTGLIAYDVMKEILGEQLDYVHCGDEVADL